MGERFRNYSVVTANPVNPETGISTLEGSVQGVYLATLPDHTILVASASGNIYRCGEDAAEVPDKNLSGGLKEFTRTIRELNR